MRRRALQRFALFSTLAAIALTTHDGARAAPDVASRPRDGLHAPPPLSSIVEGSLLVRARDGQQIDVPNARRVAVLAGGWERWDLDERTSAEATIAARDAIARRPELGALDVELDLYRSAQLVPDDEGFKAQWPLHIMHAPDAWDVTTGDPQLVVAVVDTGVITDHPDLSVRLIAGYDFITDPASSGDGDGRDGSAYDDGTESEASSGFHGTHIAGIIGAATGNELGMAGVDWRAHIQPVRALGVDRHRGKDSDIADAIRWAAGLNVPGVPQNQTPAKVINLSFGGPGYSQVLQDAVLAAKARGSLVIASAGNAGGDALENVPGALEGVMSVAAAGPDGAMASYSNYGPRVDLMAPGGSLVLDSPSPDETPGAVWSTSYLRATRQYVFAYAAGTSQASAYASGVAALVRAAAPTMPPEVAAAVMRRACVPPPSGCEQGCGDGLIDAARAVRFAASIAEATCGEVGCGDKRLEPAPLRPEEGCSVARGAMGVGTSADLAWLSLGAVGLALVIARRRRARAGAAAWVLAIMALTAASCASKEPTREAQSIAPPIVRLTDPIPTYKDGDLQISVGEGRWLEATVTPTTDLEEVVLRGVTPDETFARAAHAPFRFFLPKSAPGAEGRRLVCISATDAAQQSGETCFLAVK